MFEHTAHRTALTLSVLVSCVAAATAQQHTWTDATGKFSVEAEFVAINDGKAVLRIAAGKTISVPVGSIFA